MPQKPNLFGQLYEFITNLDQKLNIRLNPKANKEDCDKALPEIHHESQRKIRSKVFNGVEDPIRYNPGVKQAVGYGSNEGE